MLEGANGIIAIVVLLVINGFFVAAEFALVKAKNFRIDAMADQGSKAAILTQRIQEDLESYLAACQLGITMASLGLGWVGEPVVAGFLEPLFHALGLPDAMIHTSAFILGFLIFSSLHIVIGEQVPKTFAIRKSEPVSLWCAYPLRWFYLMAFPLNWLLNKASVSILNLFKVEEADHGDVLSNAEIQGIINTSEMHGELDTEKAVMLHNMFKFDSHSVENIMVSRKEVDVLNLESSWQDNLAIIRDNRHSRFPVFDGDPDNPIGIALVKDIYSVLTGDEKVDNQNQIIRDNLREPLMVPESQPISKLFELMRKTRVHIAIVMDEYGCFSGVVTMEDMLEEIVGEIADELDVDEPDSLAVWVVDHWEADGLTSLIDLERIIDADFPDDRDTITVTGVFMSLLDRMPTKGDQIEYCGFSFKAIEIVNNRVGRVHITPLSSVASEITEVVPPENL